MTPMLAAVDYGGDFFVPPVNELFEFAPVLPLGINRVVLIVFTATLMTMALFYAAFRSPRIVPGRVQAGAEAIVGFVRDQIAIDVIGPEGRKYVPFLTTLFMFVALNNLFEVIPLVNFPSTSRIAIPLFLAAIVWTTFIVVGMRKQGAIGYFKEIAFPPGIPWPVYILLTPIEILSNLILRPFTLMIRLFANMVAGHILLTIVFTATHAFLRIPGLAPEGSNLAGLPVGIMTLLVSPLAVGFEIFIALLQAYIFVILTAVYIGSSVEAAH